IADGPAVAISAPMAIRVAVPGGRCCVWVFAGIFSRPPGPPFFASGPLSGPPLASSRAWVGGWGFRGRRRGSGGGGGTGSGGRGAEGLGRGGTAGVFEVEANTVLGWLVEAAEQLRAFSQYFLHDVRVRQVQLDELFALLSAVKEGEVSATEAIARLERSPQWV